MSDLLDRILSDPLAESPYASGAHSQALDLVIRSTAGDERLARHRSLVSRALADQLTTDNPSLLATVIVSARQRVAAAAPVLARLAGPIDAPSRTSEIGVGIEVPAIVDPVEKNPAWPAIPPSTAVTLNTRTAVAGADFSMPLFDLAEGVDPDTDLASSTLAALEGALLDDLISVAATAADLAAAFAACAPLADTVVVGPGALVANATLFANLAAAGAGLTVVATPNLDPATAALVLSRGSVILDATTPAIYRQTEPGLLGVAIAAIAYGRAGSARAGAVQKVAAA
jgi:hypothetical protein